ncbi:MAG TPA: alpha/beta fold hydrolase [Thermoanaerobaculia bacterium]|nr:alpha/beta fold hydrolase [Thermoanaerobaculia bacterium]
MSEAGAGARANEKHRKKNLAMAPDGRRVRSRTLSLQGMRMYHERHGHGQPLLLLHGFNGAGSDWASFLESWSADYELIIPDLRGHGRSTNPSRQYTHRQAAKDLIALLDRLGIASCKAVGVSGGGNALLHLATRAPGRVEAMVLVSAASYYGASAREFMRQYLVEDPADEAWRIMRQRHRRGDDQIRELWAQARGFKDSYDDMSFTPPQLATITAETLIVCGDRDPLVPAALAVEMHDAIPRSYLWIVPNAGHGPISGDMKGPFVETATAFLRGDWRSR